MTTEPVLVHVAETLGNCPRCRRPLDPTQRVYGPCYQCRTFLQDWATQLYAWRSFMVWLWWPAPWSIPAWERWEEET